MITIKELLTPGKYFMGGSDGDSLIQSVLKFSSKVKYLKKIASTHSYSTVYLVVTGGATVFIVSYCEGDVTVQEKKMRELNLDVLFETCGKIYDWILPHDDDIQMRDDIENTLIRNILK